MNQQLNLNSQARIPESFISSFTGAGGAENDYLVNQKINNEVANSKLIQQANLNPFSSNFNNIQGQGLFQPQNSNPFSTPFGNQNNIFSGNPSSFSFNNFQISQNPSQLNNNQKPQNLWDARK